MSDETCWRGSGVCGDRECRYWHDWPTTGNCVLRVEREHTLKEIGLSMHITKQRVQELERNGLKKVSAILVEMGWDVRAPKRAKSTRYTIDR